MGYWYGVDKVLREADIVVVVLDARVPELSKNEKLDEFIGRYRKERVIVFNKIDLIPKAELEKLRKENPEALFVSGNKNIGIAKLKEKLLIMGKRMGFRRAKVGVVGYPNVGKSAIINCLAHRARAATSPVAGTTKGPQYVKVGENLKIIDSAGVVPYTDSEAKLGIIAAKNPEKLRHPHRTATEIIQIFLQKNRKSLEETYGIDLNGVEDPYEVMVLIGRKKGFLKKGGIVDETKTAIQIVREWQRGKLRLS